MILKNFKKVILIIFFIQILFVSQVNALEISKQNHKINISNLEDSESNEVRLINMNIEEATLIENINKVNKNTLLKVDIFNISSIAIISILTLISLNYFYRKNKLKP